MILGVSDCPRAPNLQPLPQCRNSAEAFEIFLRSDLSLPRSNIINLFDSTASASDQLEKIEDWLADRTTTASKHTDLIVYYSGHGGFTRNDQAYFLAIQRTRAGSEGATSIRYIDLASALKRHAQVVRRYMILDCCFAASAVLGMQSDLAQLVIQRVEDELPPSGTAVLCSSSAKLISIAPPGERYTMFSGALLQCLSDGIPGGKRYLTLEDIGKRTREIIAEKFPSDFVRPELHVPEQTLGNPAQVPLFPNPQWKQVVENLLPPMTEKPEFIRDEGLQFRRFSYRWPRFWRFRQSRYFWPFVTACAAISLIGLITYLNERGFSNQDAPIAIPSAKHQDAPIAILSAKIDSRQSLTNGGTTIRTNLVIVKLLDDLHLDCVPSLRVSADDKQFEFKGKSANNAADKFSIFGSRPEVISPDFTIPDRYAKADFAVSLACSGTNDFSTPWTSFE